MICVQPTQMKGKKPENQEFQRNPEKITMKRMTWQLIVQRKHLLKEFSNTWIVAAKTKWRILLFRQNHQQLH